MTQDPCLNKKLDEPEKYKDLSSEETKTITDDYITFEVHKNV